MDVTFYGVRGSTPTACERTRRYGGNTASVVLEVGDEPPLLLDLGTGLRFFGETQLDNGQFRASALVSHLHWDHVQGLPFCPAVDRDDSVVRLHLPVGDDPASPVEVLARGFSPPHFPIDPHGLRGSLMCGDSVEGIRISRASGFVSADMHRS